MKKKCGRKFSLRPDGRYLAYWHITEHEINVHEMDLNTFSDYNITRCDAITQHCYHQNLPYWIQGDHPFWSPIYSLDGSRYAYHRPDVDNQPRIIAVHETDNPESPISLFRQWSYESNPLGWSGSSMQDWHPDNEHLLIRISSYSRSVKNTISNFYLLNTTDSSIEQLTEGDRFSYVNATFNHDGSKILYQRKDTLRQCDRFCDQIMTYDMETNETHRLSNLRRIPTMAQRWQKLKPDFCKGVVHRAHLSALPVYFRIIFLKSIMPSETPNPQLHSQKVGFSRRDFPSRNALACGTFEPDANLL